jgi:hypothetical protein
MPTVQNNIEEKKPEEKIEKPVQENEIFTWNAPARPFKRRDREFYITVFAITAVVGLIIFLAEGFMPVVLIISLIFLFYILNTVEPEIIEHKITNKGIKVAGVSVEWNLLTRFWFSRRYDSDLLIFEKQTLPGRLEVVIKTEDKEKIREVLKEYVIEEEVPPSFLDKSAIWFSKKLPGNK